MSPIDSRAKRRSGLRPDEPFYLLPEWIEQRPGLRAGAKLVYAVLKFHGSRTGDIYPALATLGREIGVKIGQARRYTQELVKKRLIEVDLSPGHGFANRYHLLDRMGKRIEGRTSRSDPHCSQIPNKIMESTTLSHEAKIVYGRLGRMQFVNSLKGKVEEAWPSTAVLALAVRISKHRVTESVKELEAEGLLLVDRESRHYDEEGRGGTSCYRVLPPPEDWKDKARVSLKRREQLRRGLPR